MFQNATPEQTINPLEQDNSDQETLIQKTHQWLKRQFEVTQIPELAQAMFSNNEHQKIYGAIGIRKLLCIEAQGILIQDVINANLVPKLLEFMQEGNNVHLQIEAAWALSNIACGTTEQTKCIIDQGAIPSFVKLLSSPKPELAEQAIWGLGNIAADSTTYRDMVIDKGALQPLIYLVDNSIDAEIPKNAVWALYNLCGGRPLPNFELVKSAIPTLCRVIVNKTDLNTLEHASAGLSFLARSDPEIGHDLAKQVIPRLLKYIDHPNRGLSMQCLNALGDLVLSDINQKIALDDPTYILLLFRLAYSQNIFICKSACWILSNITAGSSDQIQAVMGNPYYVDIIMRLANNNEAIQTEVAHILSNATALSTYDQIAEMIDMGVLDCLLYLIGSPNAKSVIPAAKGILRILDKGLQTDHVGRRKNKFLEIVIDKGGIEKIERMQIHPNSQVYLLATDILEKHFGLE